MKKWKDFLTESRKILKEFNKSDEDAIMADEKRFTIAYEIELVADDEPDDDYYNDWEHSSRMQEAIDDAARSWIRDYSIQGGFDSQLESMTPGDIFNHAGIANLDDGDEMLGWFFEFIKGLSENDMNVIIVSIAYMGDDDEDGLEGEFDSIFRNIYEEPLKFLRYLLRSGSASQRELANIMGWEEEQLTFDWEAKGGKGYPPGLEGLVSQKIIKKLINHFVINLDQINAAGVLPEARKNNSQINIKDFIGNFSSIRWMKFVNGAEDALQDVIDDLPTEVKSILDDLSYDPNTYDIYWVGKIMSKYLDLLERTSEEWVNAQEEEAERNPERFLDELGVEEWRYFDRDEWIEEDREGRRTGACEIDSLTDELREAFPNFMNKYESNLDFKEDGSLTCGIEFTMDDPIYMTGLNNAFEFLRIFFEDYEDHGEIYFSMSEKTGLHTNIGYIADQGVRDGEPYVELAENYNLFKALMFLNDTYATEGMGFSSRQNTRWTHDIKQPAIDRIAAMIEDLVKNAGPAGPIPFPDRKMSMVGTKTRGKRGLLKDLIVKNFDKISKELSDIVAMTANRIGIKNVGFNTYHINRRNYIEFRYPGHEELTYDIMKKATLYYAFLVKAAADPEFKKKEYEADLIGFINKLEKKALTPISGFEFVRKMRKGDIFLRYDYTNSAFRTLRNTIRNYLKTIPLESLNYSSTMSASNVLVQQISDGLSELVKGDFHKYFSDWKIMIYNGFDREKKVVNYLSLVTEGFGLANNGFNVQKEEASLKSFERDLKNGSIITSRIQPPSRDELIAGHEDLFRKILKIAQDSQTSKQFYEGMVKLSKIPKPVLTGTDDEAKNSEVKNSEVEKVIDPRTGYPYIEDLDENYLKQRFKKYNF